MQGPRSDLPERYERDGEVTQLLQAKGCSLLRAPGGLPSGCVSGTTSMSFPISEVRSSLASSLSMCAWGTSRKRPLLV
jgi:hypothetical protein